MNCLSNAAAKEDDIKWTKVKQPSEPQKRRMLALVVAQGVKQVMTGHVYQAGDDFFIQSDGGPIGLELTGSVHRPFMRMWDRKYLKRVNDSGMKLHVYKRYVDDSDQVVQGRDGQSKSEIYTELLDIANSIEEDIEMEIDTCEKHDDGKLPILDMKCWIQNSDLVYQHYEKDVSSKLLISARSAHSSGSKRSVHVSELVRRLSNTSVKLDWDTYTAPILSDYMGRMMQAGYSENYRMHVLKNALARYDKRLEDDKNGVSPMNRPTGYNLIERKKQKKLKKKNWYAKGGYTAPLFVPATPNSELYNLLKPIAESENEAGIKVRLVEKGGPTIGKMLQRPNPSASEGCGKEECKMCSQPGGGKMCHKLNAVYKYECNLDGYSYVGESLIYEFAPKSYNFAPKSSQFRP